jgi:hypothetical protein
LHSHVSHQPNRETKPKHITKSNRSKRKRRAHVLQLNAPGSAFTFKEEEERMSCKKKKKLKTENQRSS